MLLEQLGVQVRQLDGVADLLDLVVETADRLVGDVGDLLEDELLDLGLGDLLVDVAGAGVEQQRVAGADRLVAQRLGQPDHALLVGVRDDQGALAVGEHLLEHHDLADLLELEGGDDVERLVEHDLLAAPQDVEVDGGADVDPELAAAGEHVDRVVLVAGEEGAEAGRRLREPVDLLLELHDLVAGLTQGLGEALVLGRDRGQRALGVGEAQLQPAGAGGGVGSRRRRSATSASRKRTWLTISSGLRSPLERPSDVGIGVTSCPCDPTRVPLPGKRNPRRCWSRFRSGLTSRLRRSPRPREPPGTPGGRGPV